MNKYITIINELSSNKYTKIYSDLCASRLTNKTDSNIHEKHHILPKSFKLGGKKDLENFVHFTPREHFIAHMLLSKMFSDKRKHSQMQKAVGAFFMSNKSQCRILNSRQYGYARKCSAEANKNIHAGSKRLTETKLLMSKNSKANTQEVKDKTAATKLELYGHSGFNNPEKTKKTKLERYGDETYTNKEKSKLTCLEKYGVENPAQAQIVIEKTINTQIQKYGDIWVKTEEFKEKSKQTCLVNHGVENVMQSRSFKEKSKQTNLEIYGFENAASSPLIKAKVKQTNLEKYGASLKANAPITCEYCGHTTILQWYNRKHKDGKCFNSNVNS